MAGFVRIRQVQSRPNLSIGRTLRLSSDRHDLIPPPLANIINQNKIVLYNELTNYYNIKLQEYSNSKSS